MVGYETGEVISAEGWAIQRVGPWVLGVWHVPLTEDRIIACRRLYREAQRAHGRFSVYSQHHTNPFPLEVLAGQRARDLVVSLLREFHDAFEVVVVGIEGTGFAASMMRLGAATVVHGMRRGMPITIVSSVDEGVGEARRRGALALVGASTLEAHLRTLADRAAR